MFLPGRRENAEEAAEHCKRRGTIRGCSRVPPAGEHRTNAAPAVRRRVDGAVSPAWSAIGRLTQMAANRAQAPAHWTWIDGTLAVRYETADGIAVNPTGTNALWTIPAVVHRLHQLVLEFLYAAAHRKVRDNEHFGYYDLARGQETARHVCDAPQGPCKKGRVLLMYVEGVRALSVIHRIVHHRARANFSDAIIRHDCRSCNTRPRRMPGNLRFVKQIDPGLVKVVPRQSAHC